MRISEGSGAAPWAHSTVRMCNEATFGLEIQKVDGNLHATIVQMSKSDSAHWTTEEGAIAYVEALSLPAFSLPKGLT